MSLKKKYKHIGELPIDEYLWLSEVSDIDIVADFLFPDDDLDILSLSEYNSYIKECAEFKNYKTKRYNQIKLSENIVLKYIDPLKLTIGEWLDASNYARDNDIYSLLALFYRREEVEATIWEANQLEQYNYNPKDRKLIFKDVPIKYYFQIKLDLEDIDRKIQTGYSILFDSDEIKETTVEFKDKRDEAMFIHNQKIKQSYEKNAWGYTIYSLAKGDITKIDDVYSQSMWKVFNILKLEKELELRNKKNKKSK